MTDTRTAEGPRTAPRKRAPRIVRASNPFTRRIMRMGMPMGPNVLLTVRGRTSGLPRTAPVAVAEIDGRRYVVGAYGEVDWVRNLRAAGEATMRLGGSDVLVTATVLEPALAHEFFAKTLPGYVGSLPRIGRAFIRALFRLVAPDILGDADRAAATRPVFELRSVASA